MSSSIIRVLVVEDHEPYREFVSSILQKRSELRFIFQGADGAEAVRIAENLLPDLILLDIGLPGLNGIEAARRILQQCPDSRILFVSQESSADIVMEALSTGALGYLAKADAGSELIVAVNYVLLGQKFLSSSVAKVECQLHIS